jgi:hypothetical protein
VTGLIWATGLAGRPVSSVIDVDSQDREEVSPNTILDRI